MKDHDIEVVRSFEYLGTGINNDNDETVKIKARILALLKPVPICKLYLDLNKSTEII
jgi:hypothetical protein